MEDGRENPPTGTHRLRGVAQMAAGATIAAAGVPMLVLPGPGAIAIAGGVALAARGQRSYSGRTATPVEEWLDAVADKAVAVAKVEADKAAQAAQEKIDEVGQEVQARAIEAGRAAKEQVAQAAVSAADGVGEAARKLAERLRRQG